MAWRDLGRQMRPEESLYEYRVILVSMKLPEEIPWFRASRRGVVAAMSACLRKRAPSVVYRAYTISDLKSVAEIRFRETHACNLVSGDVKPLLD